MHKKCTLQLRLKKYLLLWSEIKQLTLKNIIPKNGSKMHAKFESLAGKGSCGDCEELGEAPHSNQSFGILWCANEEHISKGAFRTLLALHLNALGCFKEWSSSHSLRVATRREGSPLHASLVGGDWASCQSTSGPSDAHVRLSFWDTLKIALSWFFGWIVWMLTTS